MWTPVDGFSGATALGVSAIEGMAGIARQRPDLDAGIPGPDAGLDWRNVRLACLIGAVILIYTRIASWRIMCRVLPA